MKLNWAKTPEAQVTVRSMSQSTSVSDATLQNTSECPYLDEYKPFHRWKSLLAYTIFILFCNLAIPNVLYYTLKNHTNLSLHLLIAIASASLGISSCFDSPFRMWKLWKHRDRYGPLNDENVWHFDFTNHVYSICLLIFALPLAWASSVNPPLVHFFLMSTAVLVAPLGVILLVSLLKPKCPWWNSSDPPKAPMRPAFFYLIEDIGAVDFRHGREFRKTLIARYDASAPFQHLMTVLTAFWAFGCFLYVGLDALVTYTAGLDIAFGLTLGLLFAWLSVWGILTVVYIRMWRSKEEKWFADRKPTEEIPRLISGRPSEHHQRRRSMSERNRTFSMPSPAHSRHHFENQPQPVPPRRVMTEPSVAKPLYR